MSNPINDKEQEKIQETVFFGFIEGLVREGLLNIEGKTNDEIFKESKGILKNCDIRVVVDYRKDILKYARFFYDIGEYKICCLLYATWFEHWINSVIDTLLRRKQISVKEITQLIKEISFPGKYTWLLRVLGFQRISPMHLKKILKVAELRNSFVHYKWKAADDSQDNIDEEVLKDIEKTVKYLNNYENKYIFKSSKKRIKELKHS